MLIDMRKYALIVVGVLLIAVGFHVTINVSRVVKLTAKESSQRALVGEAWELLEEYKTKNGTYPATLDRLSFTYPDGGSSELMKDIIYISSGTSCSLKTVGYSSGDTFGGNSEAGADHQAAQPNDGTPLNEQFPTPTSKHDPQ